jgi:hypothetical protein
MKRLPLIGALLILLSACQPSASTPVPTSTLTLTPSPTATVEWFPPTPTSEILPTSQPNPTQVLPLELGDIIYKDEFQQPDDWTLPVTENGQINFSNGEANIIINASGTFLYGTREKPDLTDFYAEITVNPILCVDQDEYGFLFRVSGRDKYYRYALSCNGEVRLDRISTEGGKILYPWTRSASVPAGAPSVSRIAVLAQGDQLYLFVNGTLQTNVSDFQLQVGSYGIFARSTSDSAVTVSFSDLVIREVIKK